MSAERPRDFDQAAATWDEKPQRRRLAAAVATGIAAAIPLHRDMRALEYGCGTGLVGLQLASQLGQLTAADASPGMLLELQKKCRVLGLDNVTQLQVAPDCWLLAEAAYDLLFASMVLHHVADTGALLRHFRGALAPGGYLALADLAEEDGSFHDNPHGIAHHGFDRHSLIACLQQLGFCDLRDTTVHTIDKERGDGMRAYPVFLITGKKA
jgi:ubiquinone/menaquinone biosynthesis C-methylase UbiE